MQEYFTTKRGFQKIKEELEYLKNVKRKEIAQRIADAKELGDLSENAEYSAAKEEQGLVEARINELENLLRGAVVIEKKVKGIIQVGSKVELCSNGKKYIYTLVGAQETDPSKNKISYESPLGKSLLGKKEGDLVEVVTPKGKIKFRITNIE